MADVRIPGRVPKGPAPVAPRLRQLTGKAPQVNLTEKPKSDQPEQQKGARFKAGSELARRTDGTGPRETPPAIVINEERNKTEPARTNGTGPRETPPAIVINEERRKTAPVRASDGGQRTAPPEDTTIGDKVRLRSLLSSQKGDASSAETAARTVSDLRQALTAEPSLVNAQAGKLTARAVTALLDKGVFGQGETKGPEPGGAEPTFSERPGNAFGTKG